MKLQTILLNWRTPEMTLQALEAALEAMARVPGEWGITLVDNDSQDGSEQRIRAAVAERAEEPGWDRVRVLQSGRNGGFGAGNNHGIRDALAQPEPPQYIYLLNSDAFPAPDAIVHLLAHLDRHPETGIAGSYIHGTDGEAHVTAFRFPSFLSEVESAMHLGLVTRVLSDHVVPLGVPEGTREVDWLAGASMMIRREVLETVGLFDETFFLYFEETDLCRRAADAGFRTTYVRESEVAHIGSVSTGMKEWSAVPDYWFDSRRHYFLKNHGHAYLTAATAGRAIAGAAWQLRRRVQRKDDRDPPGLLRGLVRHAFRSTAKRVLPGGS